MDSQKKKKKKQKQKQNKTQYTLQITKSETSSH